MPQRLRVCCRLGIASLLIAAGTTVSAAQPSAIVGVVTTSDSLPLPETVVHLRPSDKQARTSSVGAFEFPGLSSGTFTMIARRVGFAPETLSVVLGKGEVRRVALRLRRATLLESVIISARRSQLPHVVDREERGMGLVMYADEIDRSRAYDVKALLETTRLAKLRAVGAPIIIDGRPGRRNEVRPSDIAAIEVLYGRMKLYLETDIWIPSSRPVGSWAPIVVIWTHSYVQDHAERREQERSRKPPR